jgi:hypothetical protein
MKNSSLNRHQCSVHRGNASPTRTPAKHSTRLRFSNLSRLNISALVLRQTVLQNANSGAFAQHEFEDEKKHSKARVILVSCPRCHSPMLAYQESGFGWDIPAGEFGPKPERIFPARERDLHPSVPKPIQQAFTEARTCFRAKVFTAAAIMCRKTLEGICSEHGVKSSGTLAAQLKKLKEIGVIENRLFEWVDELRTMGNDAAHDIKVVVSRDDARDTLEFTEALIEYVFTYRHKFQEFKKRREKPLKDGKPDAGA